MNKIWIYMLMISIGIGVYRGMAQEMVNTIFESASSATQNSISIIGMICFWSGIMKVAEECGIVQKLSKYVSPFLHIIFPKLNKDSEASGAIALNMTANMLGVGNVATPLGLKAMKCMQEANDDKDTLTDEMMMLVVINTASIQLIPTSIIAIRAIHNSENPVSIVIPTLISSVLSVIVGIVLVKISCRRRRKNK